jgi:TRAP-type C4-dicarboxylate transport system substrate-binding protein
MNKTSPRSGWRYLLALPMMVALAAGQTAQAEDVIELSFATYYPGTVSWADVEHAYMDEIEKRSNGRLKVTKKHWKGLFGAKELQGAVGDAAIDIAWCSPLYTPADNPLRTLLIGGPFLGKYVDVPPLAYTHLYDTWEPAADDFHKHNVELLYVRPGPQMGMALMGDISSPDDLVGKKIRAHGAIFSKGLKNMGAVPVLVEAFDIEQQMRAGNLDATSETGGSGWALYAKNIPGTTLIDPRIGPYGAGHMIMNKDKFESLPADLQKMLADMRYEWTVLSTRWVAVDAANAMKMIEENDYPLVRFTEEQFAAWRKSMKIEEEFAALAEEYEARGVPAKEALSRFKAITAILDKTSVYPNVDMVPVVPTYN